VSRNATLTVTKQDNVNAPIKPGDSYSYAITVTNNGGNAVNHVRFDDGLVQNGALVGQYVKTDSSFCGVSPVDSRKARCEFGQMTVGETVTVRLAFTAPTLAAGVQSATVDNALAGSLDPQTPNSTNNRQTDTFAGDSAATVNVVAALTSRTDTYGFAGDVVATASLSDTNPQHSELDLPKTASGFLNGGFGTSVEVKDAQGLSCNGGPVYGSQLTVPATTDPNATNPFLDANGNPNPATWVIQVATSLTPGFKATVVCHNGVPLKLCSSLPGGKPSLTGDKLCTVSVGLDKSKKANVGVVLALENGFGGFG
jgi:uncharacterized repeat protein (TIGR01451 family)